MYSSLLPCLYVRAPALTAKRQGVFSSLLLRTTKQRPSIAGFHYISFFWSDYFSATTPDLTGPVVAGRDGTLD